MKKIKRRDFFKSVFSMIGITMLTPKLSESKNVISIDALYDKQRKKDVLVVYATDYGSTAGVADAIAKALSKGTKSVELKHIKEVESLKNYKHVIIGSPIQYDTWMDDAKQFVNRYEEELSLVKVDYFFTCLTLSKKSQQAVNQAQKYADDLIHINSKVTPMHIGQFAGVLDYSKFSFSLRALAHVMFAVLGVKEGDYRDWNAIKKWSNKIKG